MSRRIRSILPFLATGILSTSCSQLTVFNVDCPKSNQVVGQTTVALDITKKTVRSREAPVGDLVADAVLEADADAHPVAALQNAGGIRPETCGGATRTQIPAGTIT